ncbi:MAG: S24/S26 family peptidase [Opitutales bacterium]|nr:S24/S26 family peptidase [Opitutales bacterium]
MLKRALSGMIVAGLVVVLAGCKTTPDASAPTSTLSTREATRLAAQMQFQNPQIQATLGQGTSMQPLYTEDTVIMIHPIDFADLEAEMIVAYRNRQGQIVIHRLVRLELGGWVAQGINNPREDRERVTPENLLGVVYTVIYTEGM